MINTKSPAFGPQPAQNTSILLEKTKASIRRATPDSEALASSDDDQDQLQRSVSMAPHHPSKPTRRQSWLSDTFATAQRKASSGSLDALASGTSHHMTSSVDAGSTWAAASPPSSRGHAVSASLPWNNTIWGSENSKILPARLTEVLPSPTTVGSPSTPIESSGRNTVSPRRDSNLDAAIPFPIPLQPTLKTYRSQSYSVGQMEQEAAGIPSSGRAGQFAYNGRARAGSSFAGVHHRPGRSSAFGDFTGDNNLTQVQEVDDDEESATSSDGGVRFSNSQARTIEQLARENAVLRQQAMANHAASFSGPFGLGPNPIPRANLRGFQISDSVLEEPDDHSVGEEDLRSSNHSSLSGMGPHRYTGSAEGLRNASPEYVGNAAAGNPSPAGFKRGQWQSSQGFGGYGDSFQSRRHSFADVPRRNFPGNPQFDQGVVNVENIRSRVPGFADAAALQAENVYHVNSTPRHLDPRSTASLAHYPGALNPPVQPRIQHFGQQQPQVPQHLYLVTFKAARAEFYYVQEGTGLEVNEGELVIVEADRGTDLGTVAHKNVDWSVARELKEHYVQEHYNWLMMFSRQGQNAPTQGNARPPSAGSHGKNLPPGLNAQGSSSTVEPTVSEIKPKMIKRVAQAHEILTLREKEGNEAKAKRMCQQKVAEHHLNMEILDAEFQMDWKKLTFYYFADSYINFNSLVTDLFKIYKTRIWMSAINPASFVSRNPNLPPIAGASSNAFMTGRDQATDNRSRHEGSHMSNMVAEQSFDAPWFTAPNITYPTANSLPYGQFWVPQNMQPTSQALPGSTRAPTSTYGTSSPAFPRFGSAEGSHPNSSHDYRDPNLPANYADQLQSLQGLSLGS